MHVQHQYSDRPRIMEYPAYVSLFTLVGEDMRWKHCPLKSRSRSYDVLSLTVLPSFRNASSTRESPLSSQRSLSISSRHAHNTSKLHDSNNCFYWHVMSSGVVGVCRREGSLSHYRSPMHGTPLSTQNPTGKLSLQHARAVSIVLMDIERHPNTSCWRLDSPLASSWSGAVAEWGG